jgi:hypothetical protein
MDILGMSEGRGNKEYLEPCVVEDIDRIGRFNKDALAIFAKKKFGLNLDRSENISIIRGELIKKAQIALNLRVADPTINPEEKARIERAIPRYVMHPVTHRIFEATTALLLRKDMIPCEKDGTPVHHYAMPEMRPRQPKNELDRLALALEKEIEGQVTL